jgi:hypothetical protein
LLGSVAWVFKDEHGWPNAEEECLEAENPRVRKVTAGITAECLEPE